MTESRSPSAAPSAAADSRTRLPNEPAATGRLLIVANRLPIAAKLEDGQVRLKASSGGLATGLRRWHAGSQGLWIGWPGDLSRFSQTQRAELAKKLAARRILPVSLSADEIERYYQGFANRVLWPLFHYQIDRVPIDASGWDAYKAVNEKFAQAIVDAYHPGDSIWIHDYQLLLVPSLVRKRLPRARIGFFLHIPFPSSEVFRILPWRRQILDGLLGADLIGFHTFSYMRHFVTALLHVEGIEAEVDRIHLLDRTVRLGVFPMSVDTAAFERLARVPAVIEESAAIRRGADGRRIVLGIDRLDYIKGIPRRLTAFERLLTREPALRDHVRYIQVAIPSRGMVDSYSAFRSEVEEAVGRINGMCGTLSSTPIHYVYGSVGSRELTALYCAADVMLVTPLRDGMNLVAKEFLASRVDGDGVLILSEFAGATAELGDAIVVNPYDVDATADAIKRALDMPVNERRDRMRNLRRRVQHYDVHRWAAEFIEALGGCEQAVVVSPFSVDVGTVARLAERLKQAPSLTLVLDYDGTLVPLALAPELAVPDDDLRALLLGLATRPDTHVHIVSGRPRESLDAWFGDLPISLWAEHGFWSRQAGESEWVPAAVVPPDWDRKISPILDQFTENTPGSLIERKSASVAWHYRIAHEEFGMRQAHELRMLLGDALRNQPLEVLEGRKVVEVRFRGVSKAYAVQSILSRRETGHAILAIGDDRTDEDLFAALPDDAVTVAVGDRSSRARYRLSDYRAVRGLLRTLVGPISSSSA